MDYVRQIANQNILDNLLEKKSTLIYHSGIAVLDEHIMQKSALQRSR